MEYIYVTGRNEDIVHIFLCLSLSSEFKMQFEVPLGQHKDISIHTNETFDSFLHTNTLLENVPHILRNHSCLLDHQIASQILPFPPSLTDLT